MSDFNSTIEKLSEKYVFSPEAIKHLWDAIEKGNGRFAHFNHPELGGIGNWQSGVKTEIGELFNHCLREKVSSLCDEIKHLVNKYNTEKLHT